MATNAVVVTRVHCYTNMQKKEVGKFEVEKMEFRSRKRELESQTSSEVGDRKKKSGK